MAGSSDDYSQDDDDVVVGRDDGLEAEKKIKRTFDEDGFVLVRSAVPRSAVAPWSEFVHRHFRRTFVQLHARGHVAAPTHRLGEGGDYTMAKGVKNGFREIVMRSPGRFEVSLFSILDQHPRDHSSTEEDGPPPTSEILSWMAKLIPSLLEEKCWDDCKVCGVSYVTSTPGAQGQSWHADGGHVDLNRHQPCHCLNVFLPLEDVSPDMGPTEFRPGTHYHTRNLAPLLLAAKARKTLRAPTSPLPRAGDALVFDYRVLHRGRANASNRNRTFLVFTIAKPWFADVLNFPRRSLHDSLNPKVDDEVPD
jgi:hypothetical protein